MTLTDYSTAEFIPSMTGPDSCSDSELLASMEKQEYEERRVCTVGRLTFWKDPCESSLRRGSSLEGWFMRVAGGGAESCCCFLGGPTAAMAGFGLGCTICDQPLLCQVKYIPVLFEKEFGWQRRDTSLACSDILRE